MKRVLQQGGAAGAASAGAGAALTAAAASACCVPVAGPLIVSLFGAGGSVWAASLKPYSPYLLAGSFLLLAYGFWSAYRPRNACATDGGASVAARAPLWSRILLWGAAVLRERTPPKTRPQCHLRYRRVHLHRSFASSHQAFATSHRAFAT